MRTCTQCSGPFRDFRKGRNSGFCSLNCAYASRVKTQGDDKPCSTCERTLPVGSFVAQQRPDRPRSVYYRAECHECRNAKRRQQRQDSPFQTRAAARDRKYGLSPGQFDQMLKLQNGVCAICAGTGGRSASGLYVDHNHETGFVRGLLCGKCNAGIGMLGERVANLEAAIDYLSGWGSVCQAVDTKSRPIPPL